MSATLVEAPYRMLASATTNPHPSKRSSPLGCTVPNAKNYYLMRGVKWTLNPPILHAPNHKRESSVGPPEIRGGARQIRGAEHRNSGLRPQDGD